MRAWKIAACSRNSPLPRKEVESGGLQPHVGSRLRMFRGIGHCWLLVDGNQQKAVTMRIHPDYDVLTARSRYCSLQGAGVLATVMNEATDTENLWARVAL